MDTEFFSINFLIKSQLPPLPGSVIRISSLLADLNVSQTAIADAIRLDPIVSSRILRLANSAVYGLHGTVTNLADAVSTVGNNAISEVLLISGVSDSFGRRVLNSPAGKEIWSHLIATGITASELARTAGLRGSDEAFTCGMLHDIGKLILLRADMPFYTSLMQRAEAEGGLLLVEQLELGFDHAELGAAAAISWGLPGAVCHMIRNHHHPSKATAGIALAYVLKIADTLVSLKSNGGDMGNLYESEDFRSFSLLPEQVETTWEKVSPILQEMMVTYV